MRIISLFLLVCFAWRGHAQDFAGGYAGYGELMISPFASAPFPHPKRAEGHRYQEQFFSARDHYSDSSVAIFIPKGFRETGTIDFVVHFHGWGNDVTNALRRYQLPEQFVASGRNAVLVVPQGPRNASDSFGGKLEDSEGFKRFMAEVIATLRQNSALNQKDFALGKIILSGHSGGYEVISSIVDCGGLTDHVKEVWLFDALYAQTGKFLAWSDRGQGRLVNIYTENGGTKRETELMMAGFKQRGTPFFAGKEGGTKPDDLRTNQLVFLYTDLPHNDVVAKHKTFREFLETSCLEEIKTK
jgi:hypothetical protein